MARLLESDSVVYQQDFPALDDRSAALLPPSVQDCVGEDHLARFIFGAVLEPLDLGEIEAASASERGQPPFDPAMMKALLLYGYCNGVYSSRWIAKAARERVDFLSIVGVDPPDFRTVSDFRKRHLKALVGLFGQVPSCANRRELAKSLAMSRWTTKIKANASKHKAMSQRKRMESVPAEAEAEVERLAEPQPRLRRRGSTASRQERRGAAEMGRRQEEARREDPAAKAELEAEAEAAAAAKAKAQAEERDKPRAAKPGRPAAPHPQEA